MKNIWHILILILILTVVGWVVVSFMNLDYPRVGSDYSLTAPSLLDISLYYRINGISVEWYTPSFGGGIPVYPDPNYGTFSLLALLTVLFSPWQSAIISTLAYLYLGGICGFYFFRKVLNLHWTSSILGTIFFTATGFFLERVAIGHLGYQAFPLISIFLIAFFDSSLPKWVEGIIAASLVALLIHSAGYSLLIIFGFSFLLIFPSISIYRPQLLSWKRILYVLAFGGVMALLMSGSKLAAIYSYMRFFPRQIADSYQTTIMKGLFGIALQLLGPMNLTPLIKLIGQNTNSLLAYTASMSGAYWYGYWEYDMSMSPVVFVIIIAGFYQFIRKPRERVKWFTTNRRWLAWILLALFTWLTIEFTLAKGLVYPLLEKLPILSSLHVNMRFAAAFIMPLAIIAAIIYDHWSQDLSNRKASLLFFPVAVLTLLPLGTYFLIKSQLVDRGYNVTESQQIYNLIHSGNPMTITGISSNASNTDAMFLHESNLRPYEPIFGYGLENFHPEIHAGSIWEVSDGYYNMTNPSGYVFPEVNNTRPFERIPVSEKAQLEAFVNHKQPGWKLPLYQQVLDWVSGVSILAVVASLVYFGVRKLVNATQCKGNQ